MPPTLDGSEFCSAANCSRIALSVCESCGAIVCALHMHTDGQTEVCVECATGELLDDSPAAADVAAHTRRLQLDAERDQEAFAIEAEQLYGKTRSMLRQVQQTGNVSPNVDRSSE